MVRWGSMASANEWESALGGLNEPGGVPPPFRRMRWYGYTVQSASALAGDGDGVAASCSRVRNPETSAAVGALTARARGVIRRPKLGGGFLFQAPTRTLRSSLASAVYSRSGSSWLLMM
jgi:hypothetical protein